ncbi:MAG: hypothetical protein JXR66_12340 [Bacteroidales bacterium]|nr:hypothetical protein [Bacteroidales bacterium]
MVRISRRFTHPGVVMLEHMQNLWLLGSISVVNELGIADILKNGPQSVSGLAAQTGTLADPLYRVMRLLASEGIFRELNDRKFENTRYSRPMMDGELKHFIRHTLNPLQFRIFGEMMHSLKTGNRTTELFFQEGAFEHMGGSEELGEMYNRAMTNTSRMQVAAILSAFDFSGYSKIVDIGGGQGFFLSAILSGYPASTGILFDLGTVFSDPRKLPDPAVFGGRLNIVPGSFFDFVPPGGDLYTMKNILHGWDDRKCVEILTNINKVMAENGKIMIIESVVGEPNKASWGAMTDIFMMAGLGGRERTAEEFRSLIEAAGLKMESIRETVSPLSLIIAVPRVSRL